ncbi:MAG: hypothetical protein CVT49_04015 [candidate division Zixibacteria bacterium HGW-Zixibacteria-1]|nr:MAG: hypothetical protein CVT49_04015 [candidate division Zixibacteria bacterium HGW-Zixibacteria-1]
MKMVNRGSRVIIYSLPIILVFLFISAPPSFGGQVTLTSASLPYLVNTGDTITFSGTKATSMTDGLYVRDGATNVLINLGTDTLVFGADGGSNHMGIRVARSTGAYQNVVIRGGWVIHGGNNNSERNYCIELAGCNGVLVDGVSTIIYGNNAKCLTSVPPEGRVINATNGTATSWRGTNKNIEIKGGRYISNVRGYTSRCTYDGAVIHLAGKSAVTGSEYNFKVHDLKVENAPCQGIVTYGVVEVYRCTVTVDSRNFMYSFPASSFCYSQANAYCILARLVNAGSKFYDNVLLAGETYYGADGGFEVEGCMGTTAKPIEFFNNYINAHRGWDVYYGNTIRAKGFKMRRADEHDPFTGDFYNANRHIRIYNNDIHVYSHTDTTNFKAYGPGASGFYLLPHVNRPDSDIIIENNHIRSIVLDDNSYVQQADILATGFEFMANDDIHQYTIRNNRMESNDAFYRFGGYDPGGRGYICYRDTLIAIDTAAGPTTQYSVKFWPGDISNPLTGNYLRDAYYVPDTLYKMILFRGGLSNADITLQRTLEIYVRGNNGLPIVNAACSVWNDYSRLMITGLSDSGGRVSGVVSYLYDRAGSGDSSAYNDFRIKAIKGADTDLHTTFTVGPNASGKTDTLDLNSTVGTGVWGAGGDTPEDNVPPERIDDLGAAPGDRSDEVVLSWSAPGDDGYVGTASQYDIRYATEYFSESGWYSATQVAGEPAPGSPGYNESMVITGLNPETTYYFGIRAGDDAGNWSSLSNIAISGETSDLEPPSAITDLDAVPGFNMGQILITWSAVGDDGSIGAASSYEIRYSLNAITEANWNEASLYNISPTPRPAGYTISVLMNSLQPGESYYIGIVAYDDANNPSPLSNIVSEVAQVDISLGAEDTIQIVAPGDKSVVNSQRPSLVIQNIDESPNNVYYFELASDPDINNIIIASIEIQNPGDYTTYLVDDDLPSGSTYYWRARSGSDYISVVSSFTVLPMTHVFPNPFEISQADFATFKEIPLNSNLIIMTVSGATVKTWSDISGDITWDGSNESGAKVASGVYLWYIEGTDIKGKLVVKP